MTTHGYRLKAVIFDFDGTLTKPGALDFAAIRGAIGCPDGKPILEFIQGIEDPLLRETTAMQLERYEIEAAAVSRPNTGAGELIAWIRKHGLATAVMTRNSRASVVRALQNFDDLNVYDFDLIVSREDPVAPKPSPEGVLMIASKLAVDPEQVLMVGDFLFDTQAGRAAGALTVLLDPDNDPRLTTEPADFRIRRLDEVRPIIAAGLPLSAGKLPNEILRTYLSQFRFEDASVLINPGVGEDIAAVDVEDCEVLILKSDPITFATDSVARYAVQVNANDIATSGAVPRWFLTTLLLPCGLTPSQVRRIMQDLADTCARWNITLCGGHTEITDAVNRPVVIGMMAGTVKRENLIDKKMMRPGDCVLLTKAVAVEGTAIIAREFSQRLLQLGFSRSEIQTGRGFLEHIGIVEEARLAARDQMASAMHDVTEGGLATALYELSEAGGHKISVDMDKIPVHDLSRRICDAMGIDPLGLIGSGSLLICCRPDRGRVLMNSIHQKGIEVTAIGHVLEKGVGIEAVRDGKPVVWPAFTVDEITKLF